MKYAALLTLILASACQENVRRNEISEQSPLPIMTNVQQQTAIEEPPDEYEPEQFFDERRIGKRRLNRVEISTYKKDDRLFVKTKFYAKSKSEWIRKNESEIEKFGHLPLEPEVKDFNGDGFNDVTFVSGIAARGANEIRELFIYDPRKDELVHIKNSGDYPNLQYNPLLKCLDAWIFTGSTETVFLKLNGDKLVEFASVDDSETERFIYIINGNGKKRLLRREKRKDEGFDRYINFNPVQTYR
jgi:hypothetical protein